MRHRSLGTARSLVSVALSLGLYGLGCSSEGVAESPPVAAASGTGGGLAALGAGGQGGALAVAGSAGASGGALNEGGMSPLGQGGAGPAGGADTGGTGGAGAPSGPRQKLLTYLNGISGKQTLAGEHNREYEVGDFIKAMHDVTGHYPGLWGGDFLMESNEIKNRPKVIANLMSGWKGGAAITLMYHACSPTMGEACSFNSGIKNANLSDAQWADLTTDGGTLNKVWKSRLDAISPYFQQLKDAGVAPIFRIHHEMNQGVFWWGGRKGPTGTAKLYQITHDYLVKTKGFDNIVWVWSIQDIWDNDTNSWNFEAYNPGAENWDIMALDFCDGKGFTTDKYNAMLAVAGSKPIAIGECSKLPSVANLSAQPRWVYFLGWSELTQQDNAADAIKALYTAQNVLTEDEMPGW